MVRKKNYNRILVSTSSFMTVETFLLLFIKSLSKYYDVYVMTNLNTLNKDQINNFEKKFNFRLLHVPIKRKINLLYDFIALLRIIFIIKKLKPKISLSLNPKAGLLSSISAFINRVSIRVHIFNGQIWYNKIGFKKNFLKFFDHLTFKFSNRILCESFSQKDFLKKNGFLKKDITILGHGSMMGVDTNFFRPNSKIRNTLKEKYNLKKSDKICMFVGRINYDKGINLIMHASHYFSNKDNIFFVLVGDNELESFEFFNLIKGQKNIIYLGHQKNINQILNIADLVLLPSLREGFGISVIEAASLEKPAIISDIDGLRDTVTHNETGLLFEANNKNDFVSKINYLLDSKKLSKKMGKKARENILKKYERKTVINLYTQYLIDLCKHI